MCVSATSRCGSISAIVRLLSRTYDTGEFHIIKMDGSLPEKGEASVVVWTDGRCIECTVFVIRSVMTGPTTGIWRATLQQAVEQTPEAMGITKTAVPVGEFPRQTSPIEG